MPLVVRRRERTMLTRRESSSAVLNSVAEAEEHGLGTQDAGRGGDRRGHAASSRMR